MYLVDCCVTFIITFWGLIPMSSTPETPTKSSMVAETPIMVGGHFAKTPPRIPRIIHFTVPMKTDGDSERRIEKARELHPGWEIRVWRDPITPRTFRPSHLWPTVNSG